MIFLKKQNDICVYFINGTNQIHLINILVYNEPFIDLFIYFFKPKITKNI